MDRVYIQRCFDLARLGAQSVSPNPMVGSVLVYDGRIIGEGYHQQPGSAHAEIRAIESVSPADVDLISRSTLYVSLEPCCHHGRTPPCTDYIIEKRIPRVVVSRLDPNPKVSGAGLARLRAHNIEVVSGVLEAQGSELIVDFDRSMTLQRPRVVIKLVQSKDGYIGVPERQIWLSNSYESTLVHKLRSEVDAIMVGTNTAVIDDPQLTNRYPSGKQPLRVVLDRKHRIPGTHNLFDGSAPTLVVTRNVPDEAQRVANIEYFRTDFGNSVLSDVLSYLWKKGVQSLLVEGGAQLISSFVESQLWDEAWVVTSEKTLSKGIKGPDVIGEVRQEFRMDGDILRIIKPATR